MTRRALEEARTAREVCAHLEHHPALRGWRQSGSHRIFTGPDGAVGVPMHNGDLKRGTLRSIMRRAALVGLAMLALAVVIGVVA